ncbi:MAG: efflux RND transporter periplasmic adaptor subunit [Thiohalomonadaceae bacterium]
MNRTLVAILAVALFAGGLLAGRALAPDHDQAVASGERKVLFYRNPMNPAITSPTPAKDEMGMDYIPVYEGEDEEARGDGLPRVTVAPEIANALGVRTAAAVRGELARPIDTVGYVAWDENRLSHVHVRVQGWIEDLAVRAVGDRVDAGDLLFRIYSPELVIAQDELLQARASGGRRVLVESSRKKLAALGVADSVIREVERAGRTLLKVPVYAAQTGVVTELNVREGVFVQPATDAVVLADLGSVWVLADVFERQAAWVAPGQRATITVPALPGREWTGVVEYIYPTLDPATRTLRLRLRFDNPDGALKPNMYARATVHAEPREALHIPREALIRTGSGERVVLARGDGRFQPVAVRSGFEAGERVTIEEGLAEGDRVVTSAQFLIDSESNLKATLQRMTAMEAEPLKVVTAHGTIEELIGEHKLSMTHDPIAELGWPAMTMDFDVAADVDLSAFAPGTRVRFELHQLDQYRYRIANISKAEAQENAPASTGAPADTAKRFAGRGVVNGVDAAAGRITITHEPMPDLGWPPMTMDFTAAAGVRLDGIAPGTTVEFELRQLDAVTYELAAIRAAGGGPRP